MLRAARKLGRAAKQPQPQKSRKEMSGPEWVQLCFDADWEKDRPSYREKEVK